MNKRFSAFLATVLLLLVAVPSANAIILDPDDYIIYDTGNLPPVGILANAPDTFIFNKEGDKVRMFLTDGVKFRKEYSVWGRAKGTAASCLLTDYGWTGYPYENGTTKVSLIEIAENKKAPYVFTKMEWDNNEEGCTEELKAAYRWFYNGDSKNYNRPSDSIIIRIPQPCDSIVVLTNGVSQGYGQIVYQKELGFDSGYQNGGNNGVNVATIGFKPTPIDGKDSIDIVILGAMKDWFNNKSAGMWSHESQKQYTQIPLTNDEYLPSERWGFFNVTSVLRIKIYGEIEESVVPPFEGTVAGWDFEYLPKESGTVDLTKTTGKIDSKISYNQKYASDLGIKRFMLTPKGKSLRYGYDHKDVLKDVKVAQLMLNASVQLKDTLGDYTDGTKHDNYLQFEGKADGCQDFSFKFDYSLRTSKSFVNKIVVLGLPSDSTNWELLGRYECSDVAGKSLKSVVQTLPKNYANKSFAIRVMLDGVDKVTSLSNNVSCMMLANVSLDGYNDYYPKDEKAKKVAYISNATDRVHILDRATTADSTDAFLKEILTGTEYDVKVFTQEDTKNLNCEDSIKAAFKDFDMVILSEYPSSDADVVKNAKYLIGYKPFLNLKAFAYENWGLAGYTQKDGDTDTLAYLTSDNFSLHPVFKDMTLTADSASGKMFVPNIFKSAKNGNKYFQGVEYSGEGAVKTHFIAQGINDAVNCIVEDYTKDNAKYLMVAISATQNANLNSNASKLLKNAMTYLMGGGHFEAPTFNLVSDGAIVDNITDLKAALAYNYSVIGISNPVIYLKNEVNGGLYTLGEMTVKNSVTLKPYEDANVIFDGKFIPVSTSTSSLTFKDVNFSTPVPFQFAGTKQKLTGGLYFENCHFSSLETILSTAGSDSCEVVTLSVKNSTVIFAKNGSFVDISDSFRMKNLTISENMLDGCAAKSLVKWAGASSDTCQVAVTIDHNKFVGNDAKASFTLMDISVTGLDTSSLTINNNLFYKVGAAAITVPEFFVNGKNLALNNLFEGDKADWTAVMDSIVDLSFAGLGISDPFAEATAAQVEKNSPLYRAGTDRTYIGPKSMYTDRQQAGTVRVKNTQELKDAIEIAIDGDIIELAAYEMSETDSVNAYVLSGLTLPTNGASFEIRAAECDTPLVMGNILGTSAANINNLTITGLCWIIDDTISGYNGENYGPAIITVKDYVIKGTLSFVSCMFYSQEKPLLRIKSGTDGTYIGKLRYNGCVIDNHGGKVEDGSAGGHLFQLDKTNVFTFNNFEFINNIVSNYHGGQVFNLSRSGSPTEGEKAIKYEIRNNLFYAFGGAAKSASKFLEFNATPAECSVDITIANNIFYERYSEAAYPAAKIELYSHGTELSNSVVVTHNFYEGKYYGEGELLGANPVSLTDHTANLRQDPADEEIFVTYIKQMDKDTLGIDSVFTDIEYWRISTDSKLYTAGVDGTYLGPIMCYTGKPVELDKAERNEVELSVATVNGMLLVSTAEDSVLEVFNVLGQCVVKTPVLSGVNEVSGLTAGGIYIVRVGNAVAKVVIR